MKKKKHKKIYKPGGCGCWVWDWEDTGGFSHQCRSHSKEYNKLLRDGIKESIVRYIREVIMKL